MILVFRAQIRYSGTDYGSADLSRNRGYYFYYAPEFDVS